MISSGIYFSDCKGLQQIQNPHIQKWFLWGFHFPAPDTVDAKFAYFVGLISLTSLGVRLSFHVSHNILQFWPYRSTNWPQNNAGSFVGCRWFWSLEEAHVTCSVAPEDNRAETIPKADGLHVYSLWQTHPNIEIRKFRSNYLCRHWCIVWIVGHCWTSSLTYVYNNV